MTTLASVDRINFNTVSITVAFTESRSAEA